MDARLSRRISQKGLVDVIKRSGMRPSDFHQNFKDMNPGYYQYRKDIARKKANKIVDLIK